MPDPQPTSGAQKLYWASDSRHLAIVDSQRSIVIWDTTNGTRIPIRTLLPTASLVWAPDRSRVAVTDTDRNIAVYDTTTGEELAQFGRTTELQTHSTPRPERTPDRTGAHRRSVRVPTHRIRELIGPKGVVVRSIETRSHGTIDIEDDGTVTVTADTAADLDLAVELIDQILDPPGVQAGDVFLGRVATIADYGAFINILPGRDGLLHVNKLGRSDWVVDIASVFEVGDEIEVVVENVLDNGKISLDLTKPLERPS